MTNEQIAAMAAWTLEDFQDDPLGAVEQMRELVAAHMALLRERDAAVHDLEELMQKHAGSEICGICTKDMRCCQRHIAACHPKWRGPQKEE